MVNLSCRARSKSSEPSRHPLDLLKEAGAEWDDSGGGRSWTLADPFRFRLTVTAALDEDVKGPLLAALADEWSHAPRLAASLQPMAGTATTSTAYGSLVRLLLQVDALQTDVGRMLLQLLPEHQNETSSNGMPLTKLILGQFRWLEYVVDGAALMETVSEMLQARAALSTGAPCGQWRSQDRRLLRR